MTLPLKLASVVGAGLLALGASLGTADAMPAAAALAAPQAGLDQVLLGMHRHYPGYHSRSARSYRHARRNSPNKYCRNQPSRCR